MTEPKSDIFCEHANENPNYCKCPSDCICWTATCKDKGPDNCSSFSLAGAVSYDPYAKNQRRLLALAKLAHEYGDENLRERLNPSKFGISCDGPLGLVSEEEATELLIDNFTPEFLDGEVEEGLFERFDGLREDTKVVNNQAPVDAHTWAKMSGRITDLSEEIKKLSGGKIGCAMKFITTQPHESEERLLLQVTLKLTPDLEIDVYYSTE